MTARLPAVAGLAVAVLALSAPVAGAATFDVESTVDNSDPVQGDGACTTDGQGDPCTLRAAFEESEAFDGDDIINVPAGTYLLDFGTTGGLTYTAVDALTVNGAGARSTIVNGGGDRQVLTIGSGTVTISGLTLTGGSATTGGVQGGALQTTGGFLTLLDSAVTNSHAGPGSTAGEGGGIHHGGAAMTLMGVTVSGNVAHTGTAGGHGGGIYVDGPKFTMVNSTVSGNTAEVGTPGPVLPPGGLGGGIYLNLDTLGLTNTTIAGNVSGGTNGAGAGVFVNAGTMTGSNAVVAGNTNGNGSETNCVLTEFGVASSGGGNISGPGAPCFGGGPGDQTADPLLGPLQDNGGETDTRALAAGTPAVDAGTGPGCPGTDQRGITRPQGAACDSGAFELEGTNGQASLPPPVLGKTFNIEVVSGRVLIASGSGPQLAGAGAAQKGRRFVPLTDPRQLTIGSFVNTKRGRARITTAINSAGKTSKGAFFDGLFQVVQARVGRQRGLTTMRLKGSSARLRRCRKRGVGKRRAKGSVGEAVAGLAARRRLSRRAIRRLGANTRGRYRTRGRHSAATVRGTAWVTVDSCAGTLTKVTRGKVAVRDFRRKKTIAVKAGKSYLAKAPL